MARHEAPPTTFDAVVSDYVTGRARELIRQYDVPGAFIDRVVTMEWIGAAAEILRELTRNA